MLVYYHHQSTFQRKLRDIFSILETDVFHNKYNQQPIQSIHSKLIRDSDHHTFMFILLSSKKKHVLACFLHVS